jgi:5-methylthioadenosine/S-adenosylhomocysteine deaminase
MHVSPKETRCTRRFLLRQIAALPGITWGLPGKVFCASAETPTPDPDIPPLVLRGTVCTMNDRREILEDGYLWIAGGKISGIAGSLAELPPEARKVPLVATGGCIYPGFIDLHKHITYDIRGPWFAKQQWKNRTEFFNDPDYRSTVENPCRLLVQYMGLLNEVCLYAEVKALAGGTTALQGAAIHDPCYASSLVRNIEFENFGRDRVHQTIWDVNEASAERLRRLMPDLDAWVYHLAEGVGAYAQDRFSDLKKFGLLTSKLVAIHCVGLNADQFRELGDAGATLVWSPLGNIRLYGQTADVSAAKRSGVNICLGSEWAPSGSKNLLIDLKVADQWNKHRLNGLFSDRELVEMITRNAAKAAGFSGKTGSLVRGEAADIAVVRKRSRDPYRNLINATEQEMELVMVDGLPLYGDAAILKRVSQGHQEMLSTSPKLSKALAFHDPDGACSCQDFATISGRLREALTLEPTILMRKLDRLKVRRALSGAAPAVQAEYPFFLDIGDESLTLEEARQFLAKVFPEGVMPFALDPVFMTGDPGFASLMRDPVLKKNGIELSSYFADR